MSRLLFPLAGFTLQTAADGIPNRGTATNGDQGSESLNIATSFRHPDRSRGSNTIALLSDFDYRFEKGFGQGMSTPHGPKERLAIFVPSMRGGGAERSMLKLAGGFVRRGFDVDLVLAQAEGPLLAEVPDSIRLVDLGGRRVIASLPSLVRYLRRSQPLAMLCALNHANIVALWARRLARVSTRIVVSERNTLSPGLERGTSRRGALMPRLIKRFYPWANAVVAVSNGVADDLSSTAGFPREQIRVIYNPIVTPEVKLKAQEPVDHPWFTASQPPVVLAAGRMRPQKDFPTLIRAFARVRKTHTARLMVIGDGPDRPALEALVRELGLEDHVSLPGFIANPYAYMSHASLFVLSSGWEGLPGALIEALYCGAPLVSTDCPSGPREILADGKYGQLVPVGDVNALADAINSALSTRIPPVPADSWRPFEQDSVVNQYLEVLLPAQRAAAA